MKVPVLVVAAVVACLILLLIGSQYSIRHTEIDQREIEARQTRHDAIEAAMGRQNVKACELYKIALRSGVNFRL